MYEAKKPETVHSSTVQTQKYRFQTILNHSVARSHPIHNFISFVCFSYLLLPTPYNFYNGTFQKQMHKQFFTRLYTEKEDISLLKREEYERHVRNFIKNVFHIKRSSNTNLIKPFFFPVLCFWYMKRTEL